MDRRSLLKLAAATAALSGCASAPGAAPSAPLLPGHDVEEATIAELSERMKRGDLTAVALVQRYVQRFEGLDRRGPALRSILELNHEAEAIAAALDAERKTKGPRGPLHGIPILLKDNIDTGDRTLTTAGSLALAEAPAQADAFLVARLRAAGAVILGKTNLSEWANIRSSRSTSGWSARGGLTRNPYALDRNTSGSSSGSAAAVAASLATAAIGTETDGSIVSPSSICGLVGMKPTVGLVSRAGIVPISHTQDTAGPMTRTVTDAALILTAIAAPDPKDAATAAQPKDPVDYMKALDPAAARGKRIGVVRNVGNLHAKVLEVFATAVDDLKRLGATTIDVDLPHQMALDAPEMLVLLHELKDGMARYLATRGPKIGVKTLEDVVRFNKAHARDELRHFGQELFESAITKGPLDSQTYKDALATCKKLARDEGIDAVMRDKSLDLFVAPTGGVAWITDLVNGDAFTGSSSSPAAVAGYPSITVPAGALLGLPIGVSFFGKAWSEALLLGVAFAYEQATKHRKKPEYKATVSDAA